ncbi:MAG: hypothetical protein AAGF12_17320 [Myxococcota bacterium]
MIVTDCPNCGAHAPVSVAEPDTLRCDYCGHVGPMPEATRSELLQAAQALASIAREKLQISRAHQRVVRSLWTATARYVAYSVLFGAPLLICLVSGMALVSSGRQMQLAALACGGPFFVYFFGFLIGLLVVRRRVRRVAAAAAAFPPVKPGAPYRCHVCGGDLRLADPQAVVRCTYCSADNLASDEAIRVAGERRIDVDTDFVTAVRAEVRGVQSASDRLGLRMFGAAAVAPVAGVFASGCIFCGLMQLDAEPGDESLYAVVETPAGPCIAEYIYGGTELHFGETPIPGVEKKMASSDAAVVATLRGPELVGRSVVVPSRSAPRTAMVVRIVGKYFAGNMAVIQYDGQTSQTRVGLRGLCMADVDPSAAEPAF